MKFVKYTSAVIVFFIVIVFTGELFIWNLDNFETAYNYVTFYPQENTMQDEMKEDILSCAEKENIIVFVVNRTMNSLISENIDIYATNENIRSYLREESSIVPGRYASLFLGNINVCIKSWREIPDIKQIEYYYLIGEYDNIINFKKALVDRYAGRFPQEGYRAIDDNFFLAAIWICAMSLLLLLTLYETAQLKKRVIIMITMGEAIGGFVLKNIVEDIVIIMVIFASLLYMLSHYINVFYMKLVSFSFFGIFLFLNSLVYTWLLFTDYKKDIQTQKSMEKVLKMSYIYKMLSSIAFMICLTGCIELISNGVNYYMQKSFFEDKQDYYYITVGGNTIDQAREMLGQYYIQGVKTNQEIGLTDLGKWDTDVEYVLADQGAIHYVTERIPEIKGKIEDDKIYYLVPAGYYNDRTFDDMKDICYSYYEKEYAYEIIKYERDIRLLAVSNTGKVQSVLKKNPVIILNNLKECIIPDGSILYIGNSVMYNFSEKEFEDIASRNMFDGVHYRTNVYENYMYYWSVIKREMVSGIILLVMVLALECMIMRCLIRYEYQIRAKEFLLEKILGNGFLYRQRKIIFILMGGWLSLIVSFIICKTFYLKSVITITISGMSVMCIEHILAMEYAYRMEKLNITKIFKGGLL